MQVRHLCVGLDRAPTPIRLIRRAYRGLSLELICAMVKIRKGRVAGSRFYADYSWCSSRTTNPRIISARNPTPRFGRFQHFEHGGSNEDETRSRIGDHGRGHRPGRSGPGRDARGLRGGHGQR